MSHQTPNTKHQTPNTKHQTPIIVDDKTKSPCKPVYIKPQVSVFLHATDINGGSTDVAESNSGALLNS